MPSSASQRSYRSISSRKNDRRAGKYDYDDSYSDDSHSSDSDNYTSHSSKKSEDNWENDFDSSDSDSGSDSSYSSEDRKKKKKKKSWRDEEKGSVGSSYDSSNSSDDDDSQDREDRVTKSKLIAIGVTVVCVVFLMSAIGLGLALIGKGNDTIDETAFQMSEVETAEPTTLLLTPVPTDNNDTQSPSASLSEAPSTSPIAPSLVPTLIIFTGDITNNTGDDDFFADDDDAFVDNNNLAVSLEDIIDAEAKIPETTALIPNGDTYILTLPNGEMLEKKAGAPLDDFGSSLSLMVQNRNGDDDDINLADLANITDYSAANSTSDGDDDGFLNLETQGTDYADATSYALVNFYLGDLQFYEKNSDLVNYDVSAFICLEHVPNYETEYNDEGEETKNTFSICRLNNSVDMVHQTQKWRQRRSLEAIVEYGKVGTGQDVERISSDVANYSMPEDCIGGEYENFYVAPSTTTICVDVTTFVKNYSPFIAEEEEESMLPPPSSSADSRRIRRKLKEETTISDLDDDGLSNETTATTISDVERGDAETIVDASNYKNMLFMIANTREDQDVSAEFYSRQSVVNATQLFLTLERVTMPPTTSANPTAPTISPGPTDIPTDESTVAPTVVVKSPTDEPTVAAQATTDEPTVAAQATTDEPIIAAQATTDEPTTVVPMMPPTTAPTIMFYCSVCQEGDVLLSPNTEIELDADGSPTNEAVNMTCGDLEDTCKAGLCSNKVCLLAKGDPRCRCRADYPTPGPTVTLGPTIFTINIDEATEASKGASEVTESSNTILAR